jgi:hypothetical protein
LSCQFVTEAPGAELDEPSKVTPRPAAPSALLSERTATGGEGGGGLTVIVLVATAWDPLLSLTVNLAVKLPEDP